MGKGNQTSLIQDFDKICVDNESTISRYKSTISNRCKHYERFWLACWHVVMWLVINGGGFRKEKVDQKMSLSACLHIELLYEVKTDLQIFGCLAHINLLPPNPHRLSLQSHTVVVLLKVNYHSPPDCQLFSSGLNISKAMKCKLRSFAKCPRLVLTKMANALNHFHHLKIYHPKDSMGM